MPRWTLEAREKQSQLIQQWKPWENSSGPKSETGKKISRHNALGHGLRSFEYRQYRATMTKANRLCDEVLSNLGFVEF